MLKRKIEKTGDEISALGFGMMRLPELKGGIDEKRAAAQLHYALERGVNYVDTAWPYHNGESESYVGRALSGGLRDKVRLATKLPTWAAHTRSDMEKLLAAQLAKLKTDRIDYYLLHSLERGLWNKTRADGALEFLTAAKADGRVVNRGFSFHGDKDTFKEIVDAYDWEFCLIQYNYLDENSQATKVGLEYASSKGMGVFIMEPLRGGNLAGRVPTEVQAIWDEAKVKRTSAEWALRWLWNHPQVTCVLSGMNEEAHVEENIRVACDATPLSLSGEELALVGRARDTYRRLMKVPCTGCRYCMPCPSGVEIPSAFDSWNKMHLFKDSPGAGISYLIRCGGALTGRSGVASKCTRCGRCVPKCPQSIDIPNMLKGVAGDLETWKFKIMRLVVKPFLAFSTWRSLRKISKEQMTTKE
jgi:uncharacterized protein